MNENSTERPVPDFARCPALNLLVREGALVGGHDAEVVANGRRKPRRVWLKVIERRRHCTLFLSIRLSSNHHVGARNSCF